MTNPTTFQGESGGSGTLDWNDSAELLKKEDTGVAYQLKAIRRGTFGELVRFVLNLPQGEQGDYAIQKSGDRRYEIGDIRTMAARPDFPKA